MGKAWIRINIDTFSAVKFRLLAKPDNENRWGYSFRAKFHEVTLCCRWNLTCAFTTSGCTIKICSISFGSIFSPPLIMISLMRPIICAYPFSRKTNRSLYNNVKWRKYFKSIFKKKKNLSNFITLYETIHLAKKTVVYSPYRCNILSLVSSLCSIILLILQLGLYPQPHLQSSPVEIIQLGMSYKLYFLGIPMRFYTNVECSTTQFTRRIFWKDFENIDGWSEIVWHLISD